MNTNKIKSTPTSIVRELMKLKSQQKYLEGTQVSLTIFDWKNLSTEEQLDLREIDNIKNDMDSQFPLYELKIKNSLENVNEIIKTFRNTMLTNESIQKYNTKEYRDKIIDIENIIKSVVMVNLNEIINLKNNHYHLEESLLPINNNVAILLDCKKLSSSTINPFIYKRTIKQSIIEKFDNNDIKEFDKFIKMNGHCGGWIDEEHNLFIKLKQKYKINLERIIIVMQKTLPNKSILDIEEHNRWYDKYIELKEKKKIAINNWKNTKLNIKK